MVTGDTKLNTAEKVKSGKAVVADMQAQIDELNIKLAAAEKENIKLARQSARLQTTLERNKTIAVAAMNFENMRSHEQQRQEKFMQLLLDKSRNIIILFDKDGRFAYCTDMFLKTIGLDSFKDVEGLPYKEIFTRFADADWVKKIDAVFHKAIGIRDTIIFDEALDLAKTGSMRNYAITFTPMFNGDSLEGAMLLLHDITDLQHAKEDAEHAKEEADAASMAKSDFLANMSHEMRTPMNAIIGMTNIAKTSSEIDKKNYCLKKIDEASTHLLGVINDILDMSKIEAKKFELCFSEFNFEKMIMKVVNVVNFRIEEKHQIFNVKIDKDIPGTIISDDQRLAQVIANLLSNAVKFTPEYGTVSLSASLLGTEAGVCMLKVEVTDTGIGISPEQKARLFSSFTQADGSISRKFGGTGLGLAISKNIIELMDGKIWVDSELGKGSTFAFTIKADKGTEQPKALLSPEINLENLRVLAVDDAWDIQEYFGDIMPRLGIRCDIASSGEEAVRLIKETGPYNIYFVDWKMPGMDGIELSRYITDIGSSNSVVIMISATEWTVIEKQAKSAGVSKFIPKPLFLSTIAEAINDCLGVTTEQACTAAVEEGCFRDYRILLAEDIEINREIVLEILGPSGLQIDCAENGIEAVKIFSGNPDAYNMIFMDVHMPEMDGYEATRRIRALNAPAAKSVPIVAMTANVFREDVEKCLASGMNDHIGKPLNFSDVVAMLRRYMVKGERG
jgi:PAS domain S-box-containing protein